jgi:dTDP-4-dehydrorhamnose reductase
MVERYAKRYLIIRTSFVSNPFPHVKEFTDQYTTGDYIDVIAPMILEAIQNNTENKTIDIGTYRKTMYELAVRTKPNVDKCKVEDIKEVNLPKDYEILKF